MSMRRSASSISTSGAGLDQRPDVDLGEAGVAARGGVEGGDPDQAVDAALGGKEAVGVLASGDEGGRLEPGLLPRRGLLHLDLEAAPLGPAQVHAQKDLGPVLGVGSAGPGVDGDDGVAGVVLAAEQTRLLELGQAPLDRAELGAELGRHLLVLGRHLGQVTEVGDIGLEPAEEPQPFLRPSVRGRGPGRGLLVVPEARLAHLGLQPLRLYPQRSGVKGSPRAGTTARGQRPGAARSIRWARRRPCMQLRNLPARRASARSSYGRQLRMCRPRNSNSHAISSSPAVEPSSSQCHARVISATARSGILVELIENDRLLDTTRLPCRPQACRIYPLPQAPTGVKFDIGMQRLDERVEVPLVEGADELATGVQAPWHFLYFFPEPHQRGRCGRLCRARL